MTIEPAPGTQFIPFTQFVLPHGERKEGGFYRPSVISLMASAIIEAGNRFECEILTTGHVHLTITGPNEDGEELDLASRVTANEPGKVGKAVDDLIRSFYYERFK